MSLCVQMVRGRNLLVGDLPSQETEGAQLQPPGGARGAEKEKQLLASS